MFGSPPPSRSTVALLYHAVGDCSGAHIDPHYSVSEDGFSRHIEVCRQLGGGVVDTHAWMAGKQGIIVTFDDGNASDHHAAFPRLQAAGGSADFFVTPRQVGTPGYATWAELREMADHGMSIQAHGLDHSYFLTALTPERLREDLRRARLEIEDHVGRPVTLLAPPGGRTPPSLAEAARECGYTHVLSSEPALIDPRGEIMLGRMAVTKSFQPSSIESLLKGGRALLQAKARFVVLRLAKEALGDEFYQSVRGVLLRAVGRIRPAQSPRQ